MRIFKIYSENAKELKINKNGTKSRNGIYSFK